MKRSLLVAATLIANLPISPAAAQSGTPARRAHHALAYDEIRQRILLTGGSTPTNGGQSFRFFNDLWEFDGVRWVALAPSGTPMSGMRLAYGTRQQRMFSFGGYLGGGSIGDLRILENNVWRTMTRNEAMPVAEAGFVYDTRRDRLVAFGGSAGRGRAYGDTWEYDGTTWHRSRASGPPARQAHAMVYDERRGLIVVIGGVGVAPPGQPPPALDDLWELDGDTWRERKVNDGPPPRQSAGIAYDSRRGLVILFGGLSREGFLGDTWSWDGTEWRKLAESGPEPRAMGYLAYDKTRDRVVLFGGRKGYPDGDLGDTWEWDGHRWEQRAP